MARIRTISDVVDWRLCVGCGACCYFCLKGAVTLSNLGAIGIRPSFKASLCEGCTDCLKVCPGYSLRTEDRPAQDPALIQDNLIGPYLEIWEGYATDPEIRYRGSSGGVLTALSLYSLEKEGMESVVHTAMNKSEPWLNQTVRSRTKEDLLAATGSRYAPSSPCEGLGWIEKSTEASVFVGRPCDAAAAMKAANCRPDLARQLGLVLTFFCAGPPATDATLALIRQFGVNREEVGTVSYRGNGWPGHFRVVGKEGVEKGSLTYQESWGRLAKYPRPWRCHLCPDGLGEYADISCGDAWHRYPNNGNPGVSIVIVRSKRGQEILRRAREAGYVNLSSIKANDVLAAQGLPERRKQLLGRLIAMRAFMMPTPEFDKLGLVAAWRQTPASTKARTILGTVKRIVARGLWHRIITSED